MLFPFGDGVVCSATEQRRRLMRRPVATSTRSALTEAVSVSGVAIKNSIKQGKMPIFLAARWTQHVPLIGIACLHGTRTLHIATVSFGH